MIGMLWYDNSKLSFEDKVRKAAAYYREKYAHTANLVYVHPDEGRPDFVDDNIKVRLSRQVMPNHFWLGVEQECEANAI